LNDLRKQVVEEKHGLALATSRLQNDIEEYQNAILDARLKKQQVESKRTDLTRRLEEMKILVAQLSSKKDILDKNIASLKQDLESLKETYKHVDSTSKATIVDLKDSRNKIAAQHADKLNQLTQIKSHMSEMSTKVKEMNDAKITMTKALDTMNNEIGNLTLVNDELKIRMKSNEQLDHDAKKRYTDMMERDKVYENSHVAHSKERQSYLDNLNKGLEIEVEKNRELASSYRTLKFKAYLAKIELLLDMEKRADSFFKVKDKRQLLALQYRMHTALQDYFNFQIKFGEANFKMLKGEAGTNVAKVGAIDEMMKSYVERISDFLKEQNLVTSTGNKTKKVNFEERKFIVEEIQIERHTSKVNFKEAAEVI